MAECTKVFISSVAQDELKPLRNHVFDELAALGHEPKMFERNLGPWPGHMDPIAKCLEAVESTDIFLLFIKNRAGTYNTAAKRTVTHLEFLKAFDRRKLILIFIENAVKQVYFSVVKRLLDEYTDHTLVETSAYPSPENYMHMLSGIQGLPKEVDPYVWFFIHDVVNKGIYCEDLALAVPIQWKDYFSDLLRRGALLLPLETSIQENERQLELLNGFYETVSRVIPHIQISG